MERGLRCPAVAALWITMAAISGDYLYCGLPYGAPTDRSAGGNEGRRGASHEFIFVNHNVHLGRSFRSAAGVVARTAYYL